VSQSPGEHRSDDAADPRQAEEDEPAGSAPDERPSPPADPAPDDDAPADSRSGDAASADSLPGDGAPEATVADRGHAPGSPPPHGPPAAPGAPPAPPPGAGGPQAPPWWAQQPPAAGPPPGYSPPPPPWSPPPPRYGAPPPQYGPPASGTGRPSEPVPADRDRLSVHLIWEAVLAVIAVVLLIGTAALTPHQNVTSALNEAGYLGLIAAGLAFSFRTGSPNLAVGAILSFTSTLAAYLITEHQWGRPAALILAIMVATLIGLVLGVMVAVLSVPAWAVTVGAIAVIEAITLGITDRRVIPVRFDGPYPTAMWFAVFLVVSVGGGALWLVPAVRRPLSALRNPGDPARWTGPRTGLGAVAGLTGSSFLAGLAAVPLLMRLQMADIAGTSLMTVAFAAVLLGGVSVFGRRGGVFGTLLGVTIVALMQTLVAYNDGPFWVSTLLVGLVVLAGLGVGRGLESVTDVLNRGRRPAFAPAPPPHPPGPPAER
jgi:ribose/xylose/arabinose/galactoside ABC-type transport system permease subunit